MMTLDFAHASPLDISHDLESPAIGKTLIHSVLDGSAFQIDRISADGVPGAEGSLYKRIGLDQIQCLRGRPSLNLFFAPLNFSRAIGPGEKKALRVYAGGAGGAADNAFILRRADGSQIMYGDQTDIIGWQWMQFDYAANGYLNWLVGGVSRWAGYPGQKVRFDCATRLYGMQFALDVGRDGSSPPAGYSWV